MIASRTWGGSNESHSRQVLTEIDLLLAEAKVSLSEVQLFAASIGPGSFTGLRIGLATVKSFAAVMNKQCVGVPTLAALARAGGASRRTMTCLAAGRGEMFCQLYQVAADLTVTQLSEPAHLTLPQLCEQSLQIERPLRWISPTIDVYTEQIIEFARQHNLLVGDEESASAEWVMGSHRNFVLAAEVGALAMTDFQAMSAAELQALYVRRAEAEIKAAARGSATDQVPKR